MLLIENVTADAKQRRTIILPDGTPFLFRIQYVPMQQGWFITELTYKTFTLKGVRICNSPNMLHQFRNRIPFGLACISKDGREPMLQQDFFSGANKLYLITADEVQQFTEYLSGI